MNSGAPPSTVRYRQPAPRLVTALGWLGTALMVLGALIVGFVPYQLWGTAIQEARSQADLRRQFGQAVTPSTTAPSQVAPRITISSGPTAVTRSGTATSEVLVVPPTTKATTPAPSTAPTALAAPIREGAAVARIQIPRIGLDRIVVAGVERDDLAKGPGHYPDTPMPGDVGNAAIAGHRTTFGAPFNRIDELRSGDSIDVTTLAGIFHYKVNQAPKVVSPTDLSVLDPTPTATLTLTSCHPKFSARQRIIVTASLDLPSSPVPQVAPATTTAPPPGPSSSPNTVAPAVPDSATVSPPHKRASDVSAGWLDERGAIAPTMLFFAVCVLVVIAARRAWRRRQGWYWQVAAVVAFLPALYFFYENLARLLPSNL